MDALDALYAIRDRISPPRWTKPEDPYPCTCLATAIHFEAPAIVRDVRDVLLKQSKARFNGRKLTHFSDSTEASRKASRSLIDDAIIALELAR